MAYQITVENPAETTLTPVLPKLGAARWVLGGLGLLLLAVGLLPLWLRAERGADTLNLAAFVFAAFGLGCLLLGILLRATAGDGPAAFVFDRRRAGVWLRGQASDNAAAAAVLTPSAADVFLPFADIAELLVVTHAHTSSSSSSGSGRTTYSYHVALHLHDGGAWELTSDADRADADAVLARLQALVAAAALVPPAASPAPALPATVAWSQHGGASQLRWRNPVRPAEVLRGLVGMGAFAGVLALFWTLIRAGGNDLPVFVYGVVAFIGGGVGLAAVAQGRRWWRDGHRRSILAPTRWTTWRKRRPRAAKPCATPCRGPSGTASAPRSGATRPTTTPRCCSSPAPPTPSCCTSGRCASASPSASCSLLLSPPALPARSASSSSAPPSAWPWCYGRGPKQRGRTRVRENAPNDTTRHPARRRLARCGGGRRRLP